jgi:hypothetical protein
MSPRTLGFAAIAAAPMLLIAGVRSGFTQGAGDRIDAVLGLLFLAGWACSLIGLHRHASRRHAPAWKWLLSAECLGLALAAGQQVQDLFGVRTVIYPICDVAWPFSVTFMLAIGGYTGAKRLLDGWRSWTPLFCGLALPVMLAMMAAGMPRVGLIAFGVHTAIAWALLGWSIMRPREAQHVQ